MHNTIPTPQERGPLELLDPDRFNLTPVNFDFAFFASRFDRLLVFVDREAGNLAAGIVEAGGEMNFANEENGQAVVQTATNSDRIQSNVNPPGAELDQAIAWTPFVDLQLDVAERQIGPEAAAAAQAQPLAATTPPPASASPQELLDLSTRLIRITPEEPPETSQEVL